VASFPYLSLIFPSPYSFLPVSSFSLPLPSFPLKVGPLNPTREPGVHCMHRSGVWGRTPVEIEFGVF